MEIDNTALVAAMANMKATNTDAGKNEFVKLAVKSVYFVPVIISPKPVGNVIAEGSKIAFHNMKTQDDKKLLMCFTSFDELKKWDAYDPETMDVIRHTYGDLYSLITKQNVYNGVIIDPYGENVALKSELMDNIAKVLIPMKVKAEKIDNSNGDGLKPAQNYSQEMADAIKNYLATNENVNKAFLMETMRPGTDKATIVVVVDMVEGADIKPAFNAIGANARKFLAPNESIGVMLAKDPMVEQLIADVEPFYTK